MPYNARILISSPEVDNHVIEPGFTTFISVSGNNKNKALGIENYFKSPVRMSIEPWNGFMTMLPEREYNAYGWNTNNTPLDWIETGSGIWEVVRPSGINAPIASQSYLHYTGTDSWTLEKWVPLHGSMHFMIGFSHPAQINTTPQTLNIFWGEGSTQLTGPLVDPYTGGQVPIIYNSGGTTNSTTANVLKLSFIFDGVTLPSLWLADSISSDTYGILLGYWKLNTIELAALNASNLEHWITIRCFEEYGLLIIEGSFAPGNALIYTPNYYKFKFADSNRLFLKGNNGQISLKYAALVYDTNNASSVKNVIYTGYSATTTPTTKIYPGTDFNNSACTATLSNFVQYGEIITCDLILSTTNKYKTPIVTGYWIEYPELLQSGISQIPSILQSDVLSIRTNLTYNNSSGAEFVLDNSRGQYTGMEKYRNWKVVIQMGQDGWYTNRFTGYIQEVSYNRDSPTESTVTVQCADIIWKLRDTPLNRNIIGDGLPHQEVVQLLVQQAGITNFSYYVSSPTYYLKIGRDEPLNVFKAGQKIYEGIEYIINNHCHNWWLYTDPDGMLCYYPKDQALTSGKYFDSSYNILSISHTIDDKNLRNSVIVIGQADRPYPAGQIVGTTEYYGAYNAGDPIVASVTDVASIYGLPSGDLPDNYVGEHRKVLIRDSSYNSPDVVFYIARQTLENLRHLGRNITITVPGDETLQVRQIITIIEPLTSVVQFGTALGNVPQSSNWFPDYDTMVYIPYVITSIQDNFTENNYIQTINAEFMGWNPTIVV